MRGFSMIVAAVVLAGGLAGPVMGQDVDCDNPQTQTEMTQCAQWDWAAADEELNGVYSAAVAVMQDTDANLSAAERGAEEALRAGQRAWVTFRDNACLAEAYAFTGGSMQPMVQMGCMARLTWARVGDLYILTDQGN